MNFDEIGHRVRLRRYGRIARAAVALAGFFAVAAGPQNAALAKTTMAKTTLAKSTLTKAAMAKATPAAFTMPALKADRIVVLKSARKLELLRDGVLLKTYPIALGASPKGPKRAGGDGKTPEGTYTVDGRQPHSRYHLALHISYPNAADRAQAAAAHRDPGGDIEIHGLPAWYDGPLDPERFYKDWTHGCVSVGDRAIEEIYAAVEIGTPIEIRP